jgi:hypothetical protein
MKVSELLLQPPGVLKAKVKWPWSFLFSPDISDVQPVRWKGKDSLLSVGH